MSDNIPEISIIICNYNPKWEKLRRTLKSILLQRECSYQLVVADDGSADNLFFLIEEYLKKYVNNYTLVHHKKNKGTVSNILNGLKHCKGSYVKIISPGDCLHGYYALRKWCDFMNRHPECAMSFCDVICYSWNNTEWVIERHNAHPQNIYDFQENCVQRYLIHDDICLGAATMCRRESLLRYLVLMEGKVIYAEDNVYRIMIYRGEQVIYFNHNAILYEYGTGISTCGNDIWSGKLKNDWMAANRIMIDGEAGIETKRAGVSSFLSVSKEEGWVSCLKRWCMFPSRFLYRFRIKFSPRFTSVIVETNFMRELTT